MIKKINNNDREFATSNCLAVYEFFQDGAPIFCHDIVVQLSRQKSKLFIMN